jgi:hypothetical protein
MPSDARLQPSAATPPSSKALHAVVEGLEVQHEQQAQGSL